MRRFVFLIITALTFGISANAQANNDFLNWQESQAESTGLSTRLKTMLGNRAGNWIDIRGLKQDRAISYEVRATLMTPEVIRAAARMEQFRSRLSNDDTLKLVAEAEAIDGIVVLVEIDPREGSGVVPIDWWAVLQPPGTKLGDSSAIQAVKSPELRNIKALAGVKKRDYSFDLFWLVFPFKNADKKANFSADVSSLELLMGIRKNEGKVSWNVPQSLRDRIQASGK